MQLFYNSDIKQGDITFFFDKEESKHIIKVLRKKESDKIFITNGLGFLFESEIILASEKKCEVKITKETFQEPDKFYTHIVVAPTKMNDRLEWFLEKATEIGIHEITPIICDHSERKVYKIDRAEKIIQAAMKQSLHYYIPKINEPISFAQFVKSNIGGQKFIAHCEETDKKSFKNEVKKDETATLEKIRNAKIPLTNKVNTKQLARRTVFHSCFRLFFFVAISKDFIFIPSLF